MSERRIVVVGAGGHGQVVADALRAAGREVLGFVDRSGEAVRAAGPPILGDDAWLSLDGGYDLANGVGGIGAASTRSARRSIQARLEGEGFVFVEVRHPAATVSPDAIIGRGVQLLARCVVQPGATIGAGAIINTGAIVEHGCQVGAFAHCATGSILCGDVRIGEDAHIGAGAVIRQGVVLEDGIVVGAGAVVLAAGTGEGSLVGVPAKRRGTS